MSLALFAHMLLVVTKAFAALIAVGTGIYVFFGGRHISDLDDDAQFRLSQEFEHRRDEAIRRLIDKGAPPSVIRDLCSEESVNTGVSATGTGEFA